MDQQASVIGVQRGVELLDLREQVAGKAAVAVDQVAAESPARRLAAHVLGVGDIALRILVDNGATTAGALARLDMKQRAAKARRNKRVAPYMDVSDRRHYAGD